MHLSKDMLIETSAMCSLTNRMIPEKNTGFFSSLWYYGTVETLLKDNFKNQAKVA